MLAIHEAHINYSIVEGRIGYSSAACLSSVTPATSPPATACNVAAIPVGSPSPAADSMLPCLSGGLMMSAASEHHSIDTDTSMMLAPIPTGKSISLRVSTSVAPCSPAPLGWGMWNVGMNQNQPMKTCRSQQRRCADGQCVARLRMSVSAAADAPDRDTV